MIVYRLCKHQYSINISGSGAETYGGRWNSPGVAALYTAESRSLAVIEFTVGAQIALPPTDLVLLSIGLPESAPIATLESRSLPSDWKKYPRPISTQLLGDRYFNGLDHLAIKVPSVVVPQESIIVLNPHHPAMKNVKIVKTEKLIADERLFR
jgi:RES domain-containing protein